MYYETSPTLSSTEPSAPPAPIINYHNIDELQLDYDLEDDKKLHRLNRFSTCCCAVFLVLLLVVPLSVISFVLIEIFARHPKLVFQVKFETQCHIDHKQPENVMERESLVIASIPLADKNVENCMQIQIGEEEYLYMSTFAAGQETEVQVFSGYNACLSRKKPVAIVNKFTSCKSVYLHGFETQGITVSIVMQ